MSCTIKYTIETGSIGTDGNEYEDDWYNSSPDIESQVKRYIEITPKKLREEANIDRDIPEGEIFYKRLVAQKVDDRTGTIENTVVLDYENENGRGARPHPGSTPDVITCASDLGDIAELIAPLTR